MIDLSRWPQADDLLDRALELPPHEREGFVRQQAAADLALTEALLAILAEAHDEASFLPQGGALSGALGREVAADLAAAGADARLSPGTMLAHYEVGPVIGRGGMGEVYRATDTKLQRPVALKVLPQEMATDAERRARFRREARLLATLSHPGIASIYGVVEEDAVEALVLEFVDGPTLADRLSEGPLPLAKFLITARSLVEAITAAHASGVLHRDLKPANIKLCPDGTVKVLDFGLAKALSRDRSAPSADRTHVTSVAAGVIGTAPYMSPEQVRGDAVDQRADIWAFGCIAFEMRTGRRAFEGDSVADIVARIIEREPAYGLLPPDTPPPVRRLIRHTLEKDPARRLADIRDALLDLDDAVHEPAEPSPPPARRWWMQAALVAGAAVTAALGTAALVRPRAPAPAPVSKLEVSLAPGDRAVLGFQPAVAIAPDGQTLVYRASRNGVVRLYRRALGDLQATPIDGTDNGTSPFFSPDGQWLGFDADGTLKRVRLSGGEPIVITQTPGTATATWTAADEIVFATNTRRVLQRVAASGGTPQNLTALDAARGDNLHLLPHALPDGGTILYTIVSGATRRIAALRLDTGETRIIADGTQPRYVEPGRLVLARDGALWSLDFDAERLATAGAAVPIASGVADNEGTVVHYDASRSGTLVYLPGREASNLTRVVWITRDGREAGELFEPSRISRIGLTRKGDRALAAIEIGGNTDIWIADLSRGAVSRLTSDATLETMPTPTPDGARVAFRSERAGPGIFARDMQGVRPIERLTATAGPIQSPYSWTPDGRTLLLAIFRSYNHQAIAMVSPPSTDVRIILDGEFAQLDPQVSPDGRWLAYQSDETGRFEIYIRPFPDVDRGRWQISASGGTSPRWGPGGNELFYYNDESLFSAAIDAATTLRAAPPRRLFAVQAAAGRLGTDFEVHPSGDRFLFIVPAPGPAAPPDAFVLMQNWAAPAAR